MPRPRIPTLATSRLTTGSKRLILAALAGLFIHLWATPAEAAWGVPFSLPPVIKAPPDQAWLKDVPEKPGKGKIAVFLFKNDDVYEPVRAQVVRLLRKRGLNVTAALRPVDSAIQYREMSYTLNLAVFIEGELSGTGANQNAVIRLRSGVTGQYFSSAKFSGSIPQIVESIERTFWTKVGPATLRACSSASKPRRREVEPMYIEAGTPIESTPVGS